jgi:hypothetical protein
MTMRTVKERRQLYGGRVPKDYLPAHNHVTHNGFRRFWIPLEWVESGDRAECPCGWQRGRKWSEPKRHYAWSDRTKARIKKLAAG